LSAKPSSAFVDPDWVLRQLPVISYFCENDGLYTMRWLNAGGGNDLGYDLQDFVNNKHYFAASAIHPDDLDVVDDFAERALQGQRAILARYRLVHVEGRVLPTLVMARVVRDANDKALGFCGQVLNLADMASLQGPSAVITDHDAPRNHVEAPRSTDPGVPTPDWMLRQVPTPAWVAEAKGQPHLVVASAQVAPILGTATGAEDTMLPVHGQDVAHVAALIQKAGANPGNSAAARVRLMHTTGREVPVLLSCRFAAGPQGGRVVGVLYDLTFARQLQGKPGLVA